MNFKKIFYFHLFFFSDYFDKRAPVIACHILSNNSKCAIIEFNDKKTVRKILDKPNVRLQGTNLSLSKASRHLASLLFSDDNQDESDDDDDEIKALLPEPILSPILTQNQSTLIQQQFLSIVDLTPSEPILIPSPE